MQAVWKSGVWRAMRNKQLGGRKRIGTRTFSPRGKVSIILGDQEGPPWGLGRKWGCAKTAREANGGGKRLLR